MFRQYPCYYNRSPASLLPQKCGFTVVYKVATKVSSQLFSSQLPPANSEFFTQLVTLKSIKLSMRQAKYLLIMFFTHLHLAYSPTVNYRSKDHAQRHFKMYSATTEQVKVISGIIMSDVRGLLVQTYHWGLSVSSASVDYF